MVYFSLVNLMKFGHGGREEKVAWTRHDHRVRSRSREATASLEYHLSHASIRAALTLLVAVTGLRIGEVLALRRSVTLDTYSSLPAASVLDPNRIHAPKNIGGRKGKSQCGSEPSRTRAHECPLHAYQSF
jgi:hypothetical protein